MVESAIIRMRLQEWKDISEGLLNVPIGVKSKSPKLLRLHIIATPADVAAYSEIDPAAAYLDLSTAVVAEQVSSDDTDNLQAGGHAQKFNTIGIDENDKIITREESLHATAGTTVVATTNLYKDEFHKYIKEWGTGDKDCAGNVDFRKTDNTVLTRILAGKNESNGSAFKVPDGHVAMIIDGRLTRKATTTDEGNLLRIVFIDPIDGTSGLVAGDRTINWIQLTTSGVAGAVRIHEVPKGRVFEPGTWIHFQHSSLVDLGEEYDFEIEFLIWKK